MATITLPALAFLVFGGDNPAFVTSDPNGGWSTGGYYVHNNMWIATKYDRCTSTLYAAAASNGGRSNVQKWILRGSDNRQSWRGSPVVAGQGG
jgi:hypothetical protein